MPRRQPRAAIDRAERPLLEAYARAWQRVVDLQEAIADDPAQWRKRERLDRSRRAIELELNQLDERARAWFEREYPRVWAMGVNAGIAELGAAGNDVWGLINTDAVRALANEGFQDLLKATRGVRRTTKALVRQVVGDAALERLTTGQDTAESAARRARQILASHGVHAVRYKDGSTHGLREYANMAVRTKTAVGYNLGTVQAGQATGVKFWEVFDGICGWTQHDGPTANGMIVTADEALAQPISHPNCRRAFGGRPDLGDGELPGDAGPTPASN